MFFGQPSLCSFPSISIQHIDSLIIANYFSVSTEINNFFLNLYDLDIQFKIHDN